MNQKHRNSIYREELRLKLEKTFNQLRLDDVGDGIKISVPNDTRSCVVSFDGEIYTVRSSSYLSTYKRLEDAVIEVLECLVSRELYDNNYTTKEINFVISKLLK